MKFDFPQPLTEKYRPRTVTEFVGLAKPKKIMEAFIKRPFDAAFLFIGPSDVGKTTLALAIAEQLEAELHHVPSRSCDLDTVASVTRMCHMGAFNFTTGKAAPWHVVIVDEVDQATLAAQHSFLSILDETARPPRTVFIFTADSKLTLEGRFISRCRELLFEHESLEGELESYLAKIYKREGGKFPINYGEICKISGWNVRDALMKLELEVMMGADRSDLPPEKELEVIEEHSHNCKKCRKPWKHREPKCELPFLCVCQSCDNAKTVGTLRANKAWVTIKNKVRQEIEAEVKQKRRKK